MRNRISRTPLKSRVNSATPKLTAGSSFPEVATTAFRVAAKGCTRPAPLRRGTYPASCDGSELLISALRTSSGRQPGCACSARAALPATCGVAIEVPDTKTPPLPLPIAVEETLTPGALTSGFRWPSPVRAPAELKLALRRKAGLVMNLLVSVADPPSAARNVASVLLAVPRKGMVTV